MSQRPTETNSAGGASLFRVRSLRWRIQIWYAAVLATVIIAFGSVLYILHRTNRFHEIDNELSSAVEVLTGQLRAANSQTLDAFLHGGPTSAASTPELLQAIEKLNADLRVPSTFAPRRIAHPFEAPYFAIWRSGGQLATLSTSEDIGELNPPVIDARALAKRITYRDRGLFREAYAAGPEDSTVLVGRYIGPDVRDIRNVLFLICGTGTLVFAIGLVGGWIVSAYSIRPLLEIRRVAADISERNLADRIETERMDMELADLANILNDTFARLEAAFQRQKQFTADASHELRTPLAVMQMHQQLALAKQRSPEEYREALETCQHATQQMRQLVESMLALARADEAAGAGNQEPFDLKPLVEECLAQTQPLLDAQQTHIETNLAAALVIGDRNRLSQVITNLLTNLTVHCPPQTAATITLAAAGDRVELSVADNGPGIAAEDLPHIFDRFYRVDQPRSRQAGSVGLGLSICRTIVESHGGTITAESSPESGCTFRISLPAATSDPNAEQ
ncbi:two-component sensor histidine kinase [Blastopirellula sp. JC732]|uniref:histidine kinase n=1 Tax=Blastopirellula sediminis TaxID=2894196 RepID=A0A9X1SEF2_9BACT|nr:ATP-binding protein [Blastopirellula sediminis]MCC9609433.1 two-component sensor histidine kinase [Blastopirellula sediminis]MCC9627790.1 two-component sensor histidine kinase [Blastopirellula sediminis]